MALLPTFLQSLMGYPVVYTGEVTAPRGIGTRSALGSDLRHARTAAAQ